MIISGHSSLALIGIFL